MDDQNDATAPMDWEAFSRARAELGAGFVRILGYFREDGEKAVGKIEEFGGTVMVSPMSRPPDSRILVASDPQGAVFALFEGETDE